MAMSRGGEWAMSLGLGLVATAGVNLIAGIFSFVFRHPIITIGIVLGMSAVTNMADQFGYNDLKAQELSRMTDAEIADKFEPDNCIHDGISYSCEYNSGKMRISYGLNSRPISVSFRPDMVGRDFALTEKYYTYALRRIGVYSYYAPTHADYNQIVWTNIPGIKEAILTTNNNMAVDRINVTY